MKVLLGQPGFWKSVMDLFGVTILAQDPKSKIYDI